MSEQPSLPNSDGATRQRTASRLRFVAPPGMAMSEDGTIKKIGRYEIIKMLGKGAMGVVYKARDPFLDRIVAVKTIVSPKSGGKRVRSAYIERFQREAKAAAKMQHPSIVTIFDVGVEGSAPFMVLEYLPGESLADRLDRVRVPLGRAYQIGLDLANALSFAHRQRIVHRDVKPANVLHAGENRWKLADFGIARLPDSDLTQVGIFMGTPGYSPPEAIRHGRYTAQADVFAWGAVLYEIISGRIPYEGPDTKTTNSYVIKAIAKNPREHDPSIPAPLADVIMRALDSSPETRYKNGAEIEEAFRKAWENCLRENLIPSSCLVGDEVPHEKVGAQMHVARDWDAPAAAGDPILDTLDPGQIMSSPASPPILATPDAGQLPPAPPVLPPARPSEAPETLEPDDQPMLVIEATGGRVSDEAPTQVLVRDSLSGPGGRSNSPHMLAPKTGMPIDPNATTGEHEPDDDNKATKKISGPGALLSEAMNTDSVSSLPGKKQSTTLRLGGSEAKRWLWALIVVAALAGGAVVAYLLTS